MSDFTRKETSMGEKSMKAIGVFPPVPVGGTIERLAEVDVSVPTPKKGEILIKVRCSTVNVDDIHIVEGTMFGGLPVGPKVAAHQPIVMGTDLSGIVAQVGEGVEGFSEGDEVFAVHDPRDPCGAWAEFCVVKEDKIAHKPADWNFEQAAAAGLGGMVAVSALESVSVGEGQTAIVVGASGGIGSLITQALVKSGVNVVGVASSKNRRLIERFGATAFDYNDGDFAESYSQVDCVFDCVGGLDVEQQAQKALKPEGRFVTLIGPIRFLGEEKLSYLKIAGIFFHVFKKMLVGVFGGMTYELAAPNRSHFQKVSTQLADRGITPQIGKVFEFSSGDLRDAVSLASSHRASGKIIIRVAQT